MQTAQEGICPYTGLAVDPTTAITLGTCIPGLNLNFQCHPTAREAFRRSKYLFNEMDANCNTCSSFVRLKHPKEKGGFLQGTCDKVPEHPLLYRKVGTVFWVHPDDYMDMPCYTQRPFKEKT